MVTSHDRVPTPTHHAAVRRRTQGADADHHAAEPSHGVLRLQRSVGNAAVARMLAQREGGPAEDEMQRSVDHGVIARMVVQREGGPAEDEMQRSPADGAIARAALQRADGPQEDEAQRSPAESHARPEVGLEGGPVSDGLAGRINSKRGGGSSLDPGSRSSMEQAFGSSFSDVRVHTDSESDALNRSISAKAFTTGSDIFFSKDASPSDTRLLAHELTHVVQQRGSGSGSGMTVGPAGDQHESAADSAAAAIASGGAAPSAQREEMDPAIAREAAPGAAPEDEQTAG